MSVGTNIQTVNFNNNVQPKMQTNFRAQSSPVKDYTPDTVEISGKKKNGMSNGAKVGIGLGILGAAALAIGLIAKGRGSQAKEVVKHIDFKEAKSLEEAKKFAKDNFDLIYRDVDDLEIMNFVNRWFSELQKQGDLTGKSYHKLITCNEGVNHGLAMNFGEKFEGRNVMGINLSAIKDPQSNWEKSLSQIISKDKDGKYIITSKEYDIPFVRDLIKRIAEYNPNKTTVDEIFQIYADIRSISAKNEIVNGKLHVQERFSKFHTLYHELGHLRHNEIVPLNTMDKISVYEKSGKQVSIVSKEFAEDEQIQDIAYKVSQYAMESPAEFVAETFARLKSGTKFDDDVMALYKKYNGPMI